MKRLTSFILAAAVSLFSLPLPAQAAGGVFGSGGGTYTVGQQFTVTLAASGDSFDSLQGAISVSGPVSVVSVSPGGATWLPGKSPAVGKDFVGITSPTGSLTVAKVTLRGTGAGSGSVSVSGVKLARSGTLVGSSGSTTSFTIQRALVVPGSVKVSSSTHPDPASAYEATSIDLSWEKAAGVTAFSYLLDQSEATTPAANPSGTGTTANYPDKAIGTYYFHIRAQNADGWGPATHFKVTIKEPDPKVDPSLSKPSVASISKGSAFTTDIAAGTLSGITFKGTGTPGFTTRLTVTPAVELANGEKWEVLTSESGTWELTIASPLKAGFYTVAAYGAKDKVLTPASDPLSFELSVANGGGIETITQDDAIKPETSSEATPASENSEQRSLSASGITKLGIGLGAALLLILAVILTFATKRRHSPREDIL